MVTRREERGLVLVVYRIRNFIFAASKPEAQAKDPTPHSVLGPSLALQALMIGSSTLRRTTSVIQAGGILKRFGQPT
jgi:hypothetical protein